MQYSSTMKIYYDDSGEVLSSAHWSFIDKLDGALGYLRKGFETAFDVPVSDRYEWAQDRLYDVKRKRFTNRGIPCRDTETVGDHVLDSIGMATLHTPFTCNRDTVERMILVHDLPQAIIDNLKCEKGISESDYARIEMLAAKVIFEERPAAFALWNEYEEGKSAEALVARDIQHAQMLLKIREYQNLYPETIIHFKHYWDAFDQAWVSDAAKTLRGLFHDIHEAFANDDSDFARLKSARA